MGQCSERSPPPDHVQTQSCLEIGGAPTAGVITPQESPARRAFLRRVDVRADRQSRLDRKWTGQCYPEDDRDTFPRI